MANNSLALSSLDFDTLKDNFKEFLKNQNTLKDYNFEGSNMNVLLDVMAYNSFLNSFYLNMVASEMFLDSAQKYDSVISHAKELNYVPRSAHTSTSEVSFNIVTQGISGRLTIPKGTNFSGTNSNGTFNFVTDETITVTSPNSTYSVSNLRIREGSYFQDSFVVDNDIENQRFVLSNQNLDANSITVNVSENFGVTNTSFIRAETLFNLQNNSNVFFLQATSDNKYEIVFGDGYFGRKPPNASTVIIKYIVTNGASGDGISTFTVLDDLGPTNGGIAEVQDIVSSYASTGGANQELIDSVKFSAPRYFAAQQRAVTTDDYTSIIKSAFGGEIADVVVVGGDALNPKQYGRVALYLKPTSGTVIPNFVKSKIERHLLDYITIPNRVIILNPEYLYVKVDSQIQYNKYITAKSAEELRIIALNAIVNYSKTNLEEFANDLRYSRLVNTIDDSDDSFISNQTDIRIVKRYAPLPNYKNSEVFNINNQIKVEGALSPSVTAKFDEVFSTTAYGAVGQNIVVVDKAGGIKPGQRVTSTTGIVAGTFVVNVSNTAVTLSQNLVAPLIGTTINFDDTTMNHVSLYGNDYDTHYDHAAMITSKFTYNNPFDNIAYPESYFEDDGGGKINVYTTKNNILMKLGTVGTIDYENGIVNLNDISIKAYDNYISFYFRPRNRDIYSNRNKIIIIDPSDVLVSIIEEKK